MARWPPGRRWLSRSELLAKSVARVIIEQAHRESNNVSAAMNRTNLQASKEARGTVASDGVGSLEKLLDDGWDYHDKESDRLARELEAAADEGIAPNNLVPFLHLSSHTIGEHLGD